MARRPRAPHFPISDALPTSQRADRMALLDTVQRAFDAVRPTRHEPSPTSPYRWRGFDSSDTYHGPWQAFPLEALWNASDALYFVPALGLRFYLPAVLCHLLANPADALPQTMLDGLCALLEGRSREHQALIDLLDDDQRQAIAEVIRFLQRLEDTDPKNALGRLSRSAADRWLTAPPSPG